MYFLLLFLAAFFIISLISWNWPVKLYHTWLMQKIAREFGCEPVRHGLDARISAELETIYQGKQLRIRFVERSLDSLKSAGAGLEIRLGCRSQVILECYRPWHHKREWADFKQFRSGDRRIDSQWFMLTPEPDRVAPLWQHLNLEILLGDSSLDQLLLNQKEIIIRLRRFVSGTAVRELVDRVIRAFPDDVEPTIEV